MHLFDEGTRKITEIDLYKEIFMKPTDFKKTLGRIALCGVFALSALTATSCSDKVCNHDYKWYLATEPTCTANGKMEGICESCGEKTYQDIEAKGHNYTDGVCTVCGQVKGKEYLHNQNVGWTLQEMYDRYDSLGFEESYESFVKSITNGYVQPTVSALGNLHVSLNGEYSTTFVNVREDFSVTGGESGQIRSIALKSSGAFIVTLTDGTRTKYGFVKGLYDFEVPNPITRIALNKKNELAIIYEDNEIVKVGFIPTHTEEIDESALLYYKINSYYEIRGIMDRNVQNLVIPTSHRGTAVNSINSYSFSNCSKLKTVVIPQAIAYVDTYCFPKGATLFVEGYTERPDDWSESWNKADKATELTVYWAGEWRMVNGVPTPNNA